MGTSLTARRAALSSLLAVAAALAVVLGTLSVATPSRASGFGSTQSWSWTSNEYALTANVTPKAARVEALPDGRLAALMVVAGSAYGQASGDVLVTRVREADGAWGAEEVVALGTEPLASRTFGSSADSAGRIVTVWAVKGATTGQWPVRSASRAADGTWGTPEELYVARTNGALSDTLEIAGIAPRLVSFGDTATLAWSTVANASTSRIDVDDDPFRARRWSAGTWAPEIRSSGYGAEALDVLPSAPDQTSVYADPRLAARASDGRISFVYSLFKHRAVHSMDHPLSEGYTGLNMAGVWDGVAERPWHASSTTSWVVHLDPDDGWSSPAKLVIHDDAPAVCAAPTLPANPPLEAHWPEWKAFSLDPGIRTSCPGEDSRVRSAYYASDGGLRIVMDYRADPTAVVSIQQYLDKACGLAGGFCFDKWDSTSWGVDLDDARIGIAPDADRPAYEAVFDGPWDPDRATHVETTAGTVTVHEQAGTGNAIRFERAGTSDVVWTPDAGDAAAVRVQRVIAHEDDVAVFYYRTSSGATTDCGMAVLRGDTMTVTGPHPGCVAAPDSGVQDVVQLADGRLAWINGKTSRSPVRIFGPPTEPTEPTETTPTSPSPSSPSPSGPAPTGPAPTGPAPTTAAPVPPATTFVATTQPSVTGRLKVGKTLTAKPGTWAPTPSTVTYRWFAGTKAIPKATKAKLRLTKKQKGKRVSVRITLTRPGVTTVVRTVKPKGKVR